MSKLTKKNQKNHIYNSIESRNSIRNEVDGERQKYLKYTILKNSLCKYLFLNDYTV